MKRVAIIMSLAVFVVSIGIGSVFAMMPPNNRPGVTKANFDRIIVGSDRTEVESILGSRGNARSAFMTGGGITMSACWSGDDGSHAVIQFFNDEVMSKNWTDSTET